jgi:hypothetical protein
MAAVLHARRNGERVVAAEAERGSQAVPGTPPMNRSLVLPPSNAPSSSSAGRRCETAVNSDHHQESPSPACALFPDVAAGCLWTVPTCSPDYCRLNERPMLSSWNDGEQPLLPLDQDASAGIVSLFLEIGRIFQALIVAAPSCATSRARTAGAVFSE